MMQTLRWASSIPFFRSEIYDGIIQAVMGLYVNHAEEWHSVAPVNNSRYAIYSISRFLFVLTQGISRLLGTGTTVLVRNDRQALPSHPRSRL